jgi:integrase
MKNAEGHQQATKRARGEGSLYQRGQTWWICVYANGKQIRESTQTSDVERAKKYLRHKLKEVGAFELAGKPLITSRDRRKTVSDLMSALEKDFAIRDILTAQAKSQVKRVRADFAGARAMSLSKEDVDRYIEQRLAAGDAPASINRTTGLLKQGYIFAELPVPKIRKLDESGNVRHGFFSELEVRRVMANLDSDLADFTLFGWLTGMRKAEIASLRWEDVAGDEIRLRAENAKTGEGRTIPFEGELADLIERRKKARQFKVNDVTMISPLIFHRDGEPIREFRKSWATACRLAGVRRLFHDLRRSAARNMLNAGVPQAIAMQITGHRTDSMFRRYAIVTPNDVRTALRRTQEHTAAEMQEAVAATASAVVN